MRRLNDERGAAAVLVAAVLVVLIGVAAVVVDVGMIYQERRELQNAADAAATAIAMDCAERASTGQPCNPTAVNAFATARELADANASDGAAHVPAGHGVQINPSARTVTVRTQSKDAATGAHALSLAFARAIGWDEMTVGAQATATWGPVAGGRAVPFTISWCEYDAMVADRHRATDPTVMVPLMAAHTQSPVEQCRDKLPPGFGWLEVDTDSPCEPWIELGWARPTRGRPLPKNCKADDLRQHLEANDWTVLVPIFDCFGVTDRPCDEESELEPRVEDARQRGQWNYRISHFARFHVHGYQFVAQGGFYHPDRPTANGICGGQSIDCVWGHMFGGVVHRAAMGTSNGAGVQTVKLID